MKNVNRFVGLIALLSVSASGKGIYGQDTSERETPAPFSASYAVPIDDEVVGSMENNVDYLADQRLTRQELAIDVGFFLFEYRYRLSETDVHDTSGVPLRHEAIEIDDG